MRFCEDNRIVSFATIAAALSDPRVVKFRLLPQKEAPLR